MYFTLKDDNSQLKAVMFSSNADRLKFKPSDGMKVLCRGRISVYDTNEGKVYISRMNSGALAAQAGGITEKVMTLAFSDIEQILEPLVK